MDTSDFRNGISILLGKGGAFVRSTLRNVRNGRVVDKTFRAGERMEQAHLDRRALQFLYSEGDDYHLMDKDSFEQTTIKKEQIGAGIKYLKENMDITVMTHKDEVIAAEVPTFVELEVTMTGGSEKGDTASGGGKPATIETGAVVTVPFFVKVGDKIKIDTRTDQYLERVKS